MKFIKIGLIGLAVAALAFIAHTFGVLELLTDVEKLQGWIAGFGPMGYVMFTLCISLPAFACCRVVR